jgi:hypothetical protein
LEECVKNELESALLASLYEEYLMGQTATMTPIDWDEFLEMLHSLPDPPSEEDHERVFDTLLEIEGREDIFGRAGAPAIYDDLNEIRFRHEHRREIQNILEMLFPWYWWEQRRS